MLVYPDVTAAAQAAAQVAAQAGAEEPWWALYTRHQHEKAVADQLAAKDFEVFLPLYDSVRRWKDRQKVLSMALFPCYVFVRGGLHRRLDVITTPGIHRLLTNGEGIAVIAAAEIEQIRRATQGAFRAEPHPFLRCGDRVRVTRGSLEGVEGILVRKKNQFRLVLSVEMLAQSVSIEIDAADVAGVKAPPASAGQVWSGKGMQPLPSWRQGDARLLRPAVGSR